MRRPAPLFPLSLVWAPRAPHQVCRPDKSPTPHDGQRGGREEVVTGPRPLLAPSKHRYPSSWGKSCFTHSKFLEHQQ